MKFVLASLGLPHLAWSVAVARNAGPIKILEKVLQNLTGHPHHHHHAGGKLASHPPPFWGAKWGGPPDGYPVTGEPEQRELEEVDWTYEDPDAWGDTYPDCKASAQSPINIWPTHLPDDPDNHNDTLKNFWQGKPLTGRYIFNNGRTLEVDGEFGDFNLPDGVYRAKKLDYHMPSEHAINNHLYAGELQIYMQKDGSEGTDDIAVISILLEDPDHVAATHMKEEHQTHKEMDFFEFMGFRTDLPKVGEQREIKPDVDDPDEVDISDFANGFDLGFYHYVGSLTQPPCTENVHWYVLLRPSCINHHMVKHYAKVLPRRDNLENGRKVIPRTNRPVQSLNGRTIAVSNIALDGEYE